MGCEYFQKNYKDCTDCSTNRKFTAKDKGNKMKYILNNSRKKKVCKIKADGCVFNDSTSKKCDSVFLLCEDKQALFIEFKGRDLMGAIRQIDATIGKLKEHVDGYTIHVRIILSKVEAPNLRKPAYRNFRKRIEKQGSFHFNVGDLIEKKLSKFIR